MRTIDFAARVDAPRVGVGVNMHRFHLEAEKAKGAIDYGDCRLIRCRITNGYGFDVVTEHVGQWSVDDYLARRQYISAQTEIIR